MAGILVQLAISWIVLWFVQKKNLSVLGLRPTKARVRDFFLFMIITAVCCSSGFLLRVYIGNERWALNPAFTGSLLASGFWWNVKSVLFEELIFRGALLFLLMQWLGSLRAIILSSVGFGVYHWFSFEILGDVQSMIIVFIVTGLMGLLLAYGYTKTLSLYVPIAIHLGWNFTQGFVFSEGSIGKGILIPIKPEVEVTVSYFIYSWIVFSPMLSMLVLNFVTLRRRSALPPKPDRD
jgi:uncharacterized protein